jgi:hypothetical protein
LDIDAVHFFAIRHPDAIVCGNVKNVIATPHRTPERLRLGKIADNDLAIDTRQIAPVAVWPDERADTMTGCD